MCKIEVQNTRFQFGFNRDVANFFVMVFCIQYSPKIRFSTVAKILTKINLYYNFLGVPFIIFSCT